MFLHIQPQKAVINDINSELITTYKVIKNNVNKLIKLLDSYKEKHSKEFFYKMRDELSENPVEIAARFIYLNKTCFNGIYRVNKKGFFNVPYNGVSKEKLNLYTKENLLNLNKYFNNNEIKFSNIDYLKSISTAQKGDFVFVDSPYDYEIGVKGFVAYSKGGFNQENQKELANELINLDKKGVK
jgi:DNA adenine methylase